MSVPAFYFTWGKVLFTAVYIRLDNLGVSRDSPVFASHLIVGAPGFQLYTTKTFSFFEFWVNSGPYPCSASMLHTEPFPQPWQFLVFNFWSSFYVPCLYIVGKEAFTIFVSSFFTLVIILVCRTCVLISCKPSYQILGYFPVLLKSFIEILYIFLAVF